MLQAYDDAGGSAALGDGAAGQRGPYTDWFPPGLFNPIVPQVRAEQRPRMRDPSHGLQLLNSCMWRRCPCPTSVGSKPGEAPSEEEGDNISWVTNTTCNCDFDSDSDSDGDGGSSGSDSEPSGDRVGEAPVPRLAGRRQTTLSSILAGLEL